MAKWGFSGKKGFCDKNNFWRDILDSVEKLSFEQEKFIFAGIWNSSGKMSISGIGKIPGHILL